MNTKTCFCGVIRKLSLLLSWKKKGLIRSYGNAFLLAYAIKPLLPLAWPLFLFLVMSFLVISSWFPHNIQVQHLYIIQKKRQEGQVTVIGKPSAVLGCGKESLVTYSISVYVHAFGFICHKKHSTEKMYQVHLHSTKTQISLDIHAV